MAFALKAERLFDGTSVHENMAIIIEGIRIAEILPAAKLSKSMKIEDLGEGLLAPGFIDVQVNGGGGAFMNDNPTLGTVTTIAESHRRFGTTGLLPTVITDEPKIMFQAVAAVQAAIDGNFPGVLGIHLEGPFLDPARKGAHPANFIRAITDADVKRIVGLECGVVMMTLAPNKVAAEFIEELSRHGILISLGHAEATVPQVRRALGAGARAFTHIYNAMSQLNGREPGMVGVGLSDAESFCGVIVDGLHVDDIALKILFATKPLSRIMLITDAMPPAAGGPDSFALQGRVARRIGQSLELEDGTLAGSIVTMDETVRRSVQLGVGIDDALRMASAVPAEFLRKNDELGHIKVGFKASLVHLTNDLRVNKTWIDGL
jgi:N-acetylglucosamine-6-phosphate deacetylase